MIALWPDSYLAPGPLRGAEASRNCGEEPSIAITISITSITIATIIIIISHIIIIIIISFTSITIIDRNYDDVLYVLGALVPKRCLRRPYCVAYCAVYSHAPQPLWMMTCIYVYIYIYISYNLQLHYKE